MKIKLWFFIVVAILLVGYVWGIFSSTEVSDSSEKVGTIRINSLTIPVLIADTPALRERGLSGRGALSQDSGMFFDMKAEGKHGIWMKEMYFPVDILWIDDTFKIITIESNVTPDSYPTVFYPTSSARYVLEVNAGFVVLHGIIVGEEAAMEK